MLIKWSEQIGIYSAGMWWLQIFICYVHNSNSSHLILLTQTMWKKPSNILVTKACPKGVTPKVSWKKHRAQSDWINYSYVLESMSPLPRFLGCHRRARKFKTRTMFQGMTSIFKSGDSYPGGLIGQTWLLYLNAWSPCPWAWFRDPSEA